MTDKPTACVACIFHRVAEGVMRCHRHAPGAGRDEHEPAHWPVVKATDYCNEGSCGGNPKLAYVECEVCVAWHYTQGGVPINLPGRPNNPWWQGTGLCRLRAPVPSTNNDEMPTMWPVSHFRQGCGDGEAIPPPEDDHMGSV